MAAKEPSQKIILIKGPGLGKTLLSHALGLYYKKHDIPYRHIIGREQNIKRELEKLRDFIGFILIDTPYDNHPVVPWQTIEITGGSFIDSA